MTESNLIAVLTMDEQTKAFKPVAHNLSAEKAQAKAYELKCKNRQAHVLFQTSRHKGRSGKTCELCRNAAENLSSQKPPGKIELEEPPENPDAPAQSEGD